MKTDFAKALWDTPAGEARASSGIEGIIMGRALYEKTIDAADAIALMRSA